MVHWTFEDEIALLSLMIDIGEEHDLTDEYVVLCLCGITARILSRDFDKYIIHVVVINKLQSIRVTYNALTEHIKFARVRYEASWMANAEKL